MSDIVQPMEETNKANMKSSEEEQSTSLTTDHAITNPEAPLPIQEWEKRLLGKRLVDEEEIGDENTFKISDLPKRHRLRPGSGDCARIKDRLNVWFSNGVVKHVTYG